LREETWHVFLAIEEEVFFYKRVIFSQRTHDVECKFIPKAIFGSLTNIKFDAVVKSDCYKGLDHEIPINIKLKSIKDVNRVGLLDLYVRLFSTIKMTRSLIRNCHSSTGC
jgi:translocation protein SEC63